MCIKNGKKRGADIKGKNVPGRKPMPRPSEVEASQAGLRHIKESSVTRAE